MTLTKAFAAGMSGIKFVADLKPGKTRLETWLTGQDGVRGAYFVDVKYLGPSPEK